MEIDNIVNNYLNDPQTLAEILLIHYDPPKQICKGNWNYKIYNSKYEITKTLKMDLKLSIVFLHQIDKEMVTIEADRFSETIRYNPLFDEVLKLIRV